MIIINTDTIQKFSISIVSKEGARFYVIDAESFEQALKKIIENFPQKGVLSITINARADFE